MSTEGWALAVSTVSAGIGLTTLSLVVRNELRARRLNAPILWALHRYGERTESHDHEVHEVLDVAELVQYGRQPTRIMHYHPVGFSIRHEEGYRLRAHVKAEDTMPLLLHDVDADNAWMLISHFPRDDRRWLLFEWVPLDPMSDALRDVMEASWEERRQAEQRIRRRLGRLVKRLLPPRSVIRPVGPTGYPWARIRADKGSKDSMVEDVSTITSLAGDLGYPAV